MSLFSDDISDGVRTLAALAKSRSQRFANVVFTQFLTQQEVMTFGERKDKNPGQMTPTDFSRLQRLVSTKPADLQFDCSLRPLHTSLGANAAAEKDLKG